MDEIDADALNDIASCENTLSFWCADNSDDIDNACLAYLASQDKWISSKKADRIIEEQEFIVIDEQDIKNADIISVKEPNDTYVTSYKDKHRDLQELTVRSIKKMVEIILDTLKKPDGFILLSKEHIDKLFSEAVHNGLISSEDIDKSRNGKLKAYIKDIEES